MLYQLLETEVPPLWFWWAAAVAVAGLLVMVCAVIFGKKKTKPGRQALLDSNAAINANAKKLEGLIVLAQGESLQAEIAKLADELTYLSPSRLAEVASIDKKITDLIGDLAIELSKGGPETLKTDQLMKAIRIELAMRRTYTERM
ncbi:MAG: hypothetical protein ACI4U2_04730 [Christensenellaceae bacterium]